MSLHCSSCGSVSASSCTSTAATATSICGDVYLTLNGVSSLKILGVPEDGKCQKYLTGSAGFIFSSDGVNVGMSNAPIVDLVAQNPAVSSVYPVPTTGTQFLVAVGALGDPWKFLAAPTEGEYFLRVVNGRFVLRTAETVPGLEVINDGTEYVNEGALLSPYVNEDDDTVELRKLYSVTNRVIVGALDGIKRIFKTLGETEWLRHPTIQAGALHAKTYEQRVGDTDSVEEFGLPLLSDSDVAEGEGLPVFYVSDDKKFYRGLAPTVNGVASSTDTVVVDDGTWKTMGTHCTMPALQVNGKNILVSAMVRLSQDSADYTAIDFGLFIDDVLVHTWNVKGARDNTLTRIQSGITIGEHDIDIRFKQTATAGVMTVKESNFELVSL